MRILSQDGKIDIPYEQCGLIVFFNELFSGNWDISANIGGNKAYKMAEYSTEAKARKAMEMLHEAYTGIPLILQNVDISDDVKGMFEKWKKQGIFVISENQPSKAEYVENVLFQFPSDDEVEV